MGAFCEKRSYCLIARSFKYHPVFKMRIPFVLSPARLSSCVQNANSFCPITRSSVLMFSRSGSIVHRPIVFKMQKLFLSYRLFVCLHIFKGRIYCSLPDRVQNAKTLFVLSPVRLSSCFQGQDPLFIARSLPSGFEFFLCSRGIQREAATTYPSLVLPQFTYFKPVTIKPWSTHAPSLLLQTTYVNFRSRT